MIADLPHYADEGSVRLSGGYPPGFLAWFYSLYDGKAVYFFLLSITNINLRYA